MFGIGDYIVHGGRGVCLVESICNPSFEGNQDRLYYVLRPRGAGDSSTLFFPVDNQKVFIRRVMNSCEVNNLIVRMPNIPPIQVENERKRKEAYRKLLAEPYPANLVSLIKTVYLRKERVLAEKKKLPAFELSFDAEAKQVLYTEMGLSLGLSAEEVEAHIVRAIDG